MASHALLPTINIQDYLSGEQASKVRHKYVVGNISPCAAFTGSESAFHDSPIGQKYAFLAENRFSENAKSYCTTVTGVTDKRAHNFSLPLLITLLAVNIYPQ